jgi:hypothetical protein
LPGVFIFEDHLPFSCLGLRAREKEPIDLINFSINDESKNILRFLGGFGLFIQWLKSDRYFIDVSYGS